MKPRTSHTHPLEISSVDIPGGGRIGMTLCPGKQDQFAMTGAWARDLDTDLAAIRAWGASALITLMESHELVHLESRSGSCSNGYAHLSLSYPCASHLLHESEKRNVFARLFHSQREAYCLAQHARGQYCDLGRTRGRLRLDRRR